MSDQMEKEIKDITAGGQYFSDMDQSSNSQEHRYLNENLEMINERTILHSMRNFSIEKEKDKK